MHILVTNDDGPPSNQSSPYVHSLVKTLQDAGHSVSVVLPHTQRSWIGKAHIVGQTLTPTYFRPGTLHQDDGITRERPFYDDGEEWVLVDGTPASCVQIGLHHVFKDQPFDVVVSGPNYGRNTTAVFALSSGTLGGAMEGAMSGMKSIGLSYAFDSRDHDPEIISAASKLSTRLIEKLVAEWPEDVHLYSINVPLRKGVENTKILYTEMLQNRWLSGSSFEEVPETESDKDPNAEEQAIRQGDNENTSTQKSKRRAHAQFKWSPKFGDIRKAVTDAGRGDGWEILQGNVTVTPLVANFWHLPHYTGEIKLDKETSASAPANVGETVKTLNAVVAYPDDYVQPLINKALESLPNIKINHISSINQLKTPEEPVLQFSGYETLDFDHVMQHPKTSLVCAYVIRKALIRKHYLSNTISTWLVKHPESILANHFKPCVHFELDYAEFLDDALVDAWDLNESMARNEEKQPHEEKEWWILKPGMSDGGNGIRLFSSMEQLQAIFEEWEEDEDEDEDEDADEDADEDEDEAEDGDEEDEDESKPTHDSNSGAEADTPAKAEPESTPTITNDASETKADGAAAMTSQLRHFIAQPYVHPPLLLASHEHRKFHIRAYILVVGALKVYVYKDMLALFAALPYEAPSKPTTPSTTASPPSDPLVQIDLARHLTNTCFQSETTKPNSVHAFWTLASLTRSQKDHIFTQIQTITGEVVEAAAREQMVHFQTLPNAFEMFGVDFLVDHDCRVWLLEFNAYPDFKQTGDQLQERVVGGLFKGVVRTAVVNFFAQQDRERGATSSSAEEDNEKDKDENKAAQTDEEEKMVLVKELDLGRG